MNLCVVGAGVSGLCSIKRAIEYGCEVIAFEQCAEIGGTWILRDTVGEDKYGLNIHSSMYKGLRTDIPKEVMCYPDFPYPAYETSYITSEQVLEYLNDYTVKFNLHDKIKFEHSVVRIRPLLNDLWEVIVRNLTNNCYAVYTFDAVLICTGNFHTPSLPRYKGSNLFNGTQLHSHDYRDAGQFANQSVLLVGAGPTGIDLIQEVSKVAKNVVWSTHSTYKLNITLPENVTVKADIEELTPDGAVFADGSADKFSAILYCTGFTHSFPFLSVDCGIVVEENFVSPLYMHCLNINRPTLGFIGLPTVVCNNQAFDFQARFCIKCMLGKIKLPSREEMYMKYECEMRERWRRGLTKRRAHSMGFDVQEKYFEDLATIGELEPVKPVIMKIFNKSICNLFNNLNNFRERTFKVIDDVTFEES